jgi:hypothetical protein
MDALQVGVETTLVHIVGMADIVANHRLFAADSTFSGHDKFSLLMENAAFSAPQENHKSNQNHNPIHQRRTEVKGTSGG